MTKQVSCCVAIKNRCVIQHAGLKITLFPNTVKSVLAAAAAACVDDFELVVADFGSTDMPLADWLPGVCAAHGRELRLLDFSKDQYFCKGRGLNIAAAKAKHDVLMFMDTEMTFVPAFFTLGLKAVAEGRAYFPICEYSKNPENTRFVWSNGGKGNCMLHRDVFVPAHGWPEYTKWGYEDTRFFEVVQDMVPVHREPLPGFRHMWHPNDPAFKNKHYAEGAKAAVQRRRL